MHFEEILKQLESLSNPEAVAGMVRLCYNDLKEVCDD